MPCAFSLPDQTNVPLGGCFYETASTHQSRIAALGTMCSGSQFEGCRCQGENHCAASAQKSNLRHARRPSGILGGRPDFSLQFPIKSACQRLPQTLCDLFSRRTAYRGGSIGGLSHHSQHPSRKPGVCGTQTTYIPAAPRVVRHRQRRAD